MRTIPALCIGLLFVAAAAGPSVVRAQPPAGSDVPPQAVRLSWEDNGYASVPRRVLHAPALERREIFSYGWIEAGIGGNNWGAPFNGPITMNDRSWQGQVNQLYLVNERVTDTAGGDWDWGCRVDLLLGTDFFYTTARGLDAYAYQDDGIENVAAWSFTKDYGLAMPQLYADLAIRDLTLRFGHFYSVLGYEQVPAVGNFFYTHSYSMQFSPFTFTGFYGRWELNDGVTLYSGMHTGWNNFTDPMPTGGRWAILNRDYPGSGSTAAYLGGVTLESADEQQALAILTTTGNEVTPLGTSPADGSLVGNRSLISTVYTNHLTGRLTYVAQNDNAWQFNAGVAPGNAGQQSGLAQWYSFSQYLFWTFSRSWVGGVRLEYFRDNNGFIVEAPLRNAAERGNRGDFTSGFAGSFWELTLGLNHYPNDNWMIRPELRYDWFSPNTSDTPLPYGKPLGQAVGAGGNQYGQLYAGCDVVVQF